MLNSSAADLAQIESDQSLEIDTSCFDYGGQSHVWISNFGPMSSWWSGEMGPAHHGPSAGNSGFNIHEKFIILSHFVNGVCPRLVR